MIMIIIIIIIITKYQQADLLPGYSDQQDTAVMSGIDMLR